MNSKEEFHESVSIHWLRDNKKNKRRIVTRRVDIEHLHNYYFKKWARFAKRCSAFARGYGITTDWEWHSWDPQLRIGETGWYSEKHERGQTHGEIKWHPWQKALIPLFSEDLINVRFPRVISPEDTLLARAFAETVRSVTCRSTRVPIGEPIRVERKKKRSTIRLLYLAG